MNLNKQCCWICVAALLLGGCAKVDETVAVDTSTGHTVTQETYANESCYQGVVYVQFLVYGDSKTAWGGPKFTPDGKVTTCEIIRKK